MRVLCVNTTPYARTGMHTTVLPLADGVLRPDSAEDSLVVHDATGSGSVDWVQWWPMVSPRARDQQGSQGWLYPSGYMKMVRVCFPVKLDAGVALASRTAPTPTRYPHYIEKWVDIEVAPGTVSPQIWAPEPNTFQYLSTTGGVRFTLEDGLGNSDAMTFAFGSAVEAYPNWHGNVIYGNVKVFRTKRRMSVPDPSTGVAIWHETMLEIQRHFDGNGRSVRWWYTWGTSDNRTGNLVHALPQRVTMTTSVFPDPYFWHEEIRLPEHTPTIYSANGTAVLTPGSGSSRNVTYTGQDNTNQFTEFAMWDPSDRVGVNGIVSTDRDRMVEGACHINSGVLQFPLWAPQSGQPQPSQTDLDTLEAEKRARIQGIAEDWRTVPGIYGNHGYVPPYDFRSSFSSVEEARASACDQADDEYAYHRSQGQSVSWPVRDPLHRAIEGTRPAQGNGGNSAGFGHVKGFKEAATTCGDLRHLEATSHQMFSNFSLSFREVDGEIMDPLLYGDQDTRDVLKEQVVPFFGGLPGFAANSLFPQTTINGKNVVPQTWGKPFPNGIEGGKGIRLGAGGDRSNQWEADLERIEAGFDSTHQDVNALAAYVQMSGDPYMLYMMDGVALHPLCGQLTPKTDEATEYFKQGFYLAQSSDKGISEAWKSAAPFTTFVRGHARNLQTALYCFRLTGDPRLQDHVSKHLLRSIAPYAVGSSRRGTRWWDTSRVKNANWPHRHEFHPATDVGSCWAWCAIPETHQSDTDDITFESAGGDRKWVSYIRNREGTAGRDFTNPGPLLGATSTHPPIFWGDSKFDLSTMSGLDTASTYSHEYLKPIGIEEHPDGTESYGCTLYQAESMNATGGFYLVGLFIFTRTAGVRELWGTDGNNCVRLDQSNGDVYLVVNGDSQKVATLSITRGIPTIIEIRRGDSGFVVVEITDENQHANSSGSLGVTLGGTFDCSGFGWDGDTTSYFDDFVLEFGMFVPQTSESLRRKTREYLRTKWDAYSAPEFALTERSGHWENVPMTYAQDVRLGDDSVMLQPGNSLFQMSMLGVVMWAFYETFKNEAASNPGSELADAIDFAREWIEKTSRWVAYHGMSSNGGFLIGGETNANWTVYKVAAYDRLLTSAEMEFDGNLSAGQGSDDDYPAPNNALWWPTSTWSFCAQYMVAIYLATRFHVEETDTFNQAVGVLERNLPALLGTSPSTYGFGDLGYQTSQVDPWLWIAPNLAGPYDPNTITASANFTGSGAFSASGVDIERVSADFSGSGTFAALSSTGAPQFVSADFEGSGTFAAVDHQIHRDSVSFDGSGEFAAVSSVVGGPQSVSAAFDGEGSFAAATTQIHRESLSFAGAGSFAAVGSLVGPQTQNASASFVGSGSFAAVSQVQTPVELSLSFVGSGTFDARAVVEFRPEESEFVIRMRNRFKRLCDRHGYRVNFIGRRGSAAAKLFNALVDYNGQYFDGKNLHIAEGVVVHIPRHADTTLEVFENDRIDVPMRSGQATDRARIVQILHQDDAKFVVEVQN